MNIHEVLEYGPIVASDEEYGILVTVNGSYYNVWVRSRDGWENTECRPTDAENGLYSLTVARAMDRAQAWIAEIRGESPCEDELRDDD